MYGDWRLFSQLSFILIEQIGDIHSTITNVLNFMEARIEWISFLAPSSEGRPVSHPLLRWDLRNRIVIESWAAV